MPFGPQMPGLLGEPPALLNRLHQGAQNNPNMLLALGMGLLAHRQNATANPLSAVADSAVRAGYADQTRRGEARNREEEMATAQNAKASANASMRYLINRGHNEEDVRRYAEMGVLGQVVKQEMAPKPPKGGRVPRGFDPSDPDAPAAPEIKVVGGKLAKIFPDGNVEWLSPGDDPRAETVDPPSDVSAAPPPSTKAPREPKSSADGMKLTEGQSKDINFYNRGKYANDELAGLESHLTSMSGKIAGWAGPLGNMAKTPEYRQAERAGREFLAIVLRKDTGAAVTREELEMYAPMYLPVPGDDPVTLADKRAARDRVLEGIRLGLGTASPLAAQVDEGFDARTQSAVPTGVTEEDIQFTMQKHGLTREQVLERLR